MLDPGEMDCDYVHVSKRLRGKSNTLVLSRQLSIPDFRRVYPTTSTTTTTTTTAITTNNTTTTATTTTTTTTATTTTTITKMEYAIK